MNHCMALLLQLNCSREMPVKITLSRAEKDWKSECSKDPLAAMIGFYIYTGISVVCREHDTGRKLALILP